MRPLRIVLVLAIIVPMIGQDFPPDTHIGDYHFYMPRGWNRKDLPAGTMIAAPLTAPNMAYIALLHTVALPSTLRAAFDEQWQGFKQQYRLLQGGQVVARHSPNGYDMFATQAIAADQKGMRWRVYVMAAQYKNRLETVMFMSNVADPETNAMLQQLLDSFLSSLHFSDARTDAAAGSTGSTGLNTSAAALPPKGKGRLNGIYRAIGVVNYGGGGPRIKWRYVVFFPDTRFMEGFPGEGLDNLDEDAEIRRNPVGWGSYSLSGERGKIVFLITDPEQEKSPIIWDLKEYNDHLSVNGDNYNLLGRVDDLKLEGTFRREDYKTTYTARQGITFNW